MAPIRIGPPEVVYENKYQQIYRVSAEFQDFTKEIYVNDYGRRVGLLLIRGEDVLLVRQYRLLVNTLAWEIPGGRVDEGETPEQGAIREGIEETCLRCRTLKHLLYFHPGLDTFDNPTFLFYSEDFQETAPENLHCNEVTERIWLPRARCIRMIFSREIVDSLTIAALLAYQTLKNNPELHHDFNQ